MKVVLSFARLVGFAAILVAGCNAGGTEEQTRAETTDFADTIDRLMKEIGANTDNQLKEYARKQHLLEKFIAPKGLRKLIDVLGSENVTMLSMEFRYGENKIALSWSGNLKVYGEQSKAEQKLREEIKSIGMTDTNGKLTTHLAKSLPESSSAMTFRRDRNGTEEELLIRNFFEADGPRQPRCQGSFDWCIICPYKGKAPILKDLMRAMPALPTPNFDDALFDRVQTQPVLLFNAHVRTTSFPMWTMLTDADVRGDLEKILKARGYAPDRSIKLRRLYDFGPAEQHPWSRKIDATHASIITLNNDPDHIGITSQGPQLPK